MELMQIKFITTLIVLSIAKCLDASKTQDRVIQACVGENVTLFNSTDNINTIVNLTVTAYTEQNEPFFLFRDSKFMKDYQLPGYTVKNPDPGKGFVDVVLLNMTLNQSGLYRIEVDNIQGDGSVNTSVIRVNLTISELCSSNISLDLDNKTNGPTSKVNDTDSGPGDGKDGSNSATVAVAVAVAVLVVMAVAVVLIAICHCKKKRKKYNRHDDKSLKPVVKWSRRKSTEYISMVKILGSERFICPQNMQKKCLEDMTEQIVFLKTKITKNNNK